MMEEEKSRSAEGASEACCCGTESGPKPLPMLAAADDEVCCGPPPAPPSGPMEKPGYRVQGFVKEFIDAPAGPVPVVGTELERADVFGTIAARVSRVRDDYRVAPGLYAVGKPGRESPVLVTANYKLTFDGLRKNLAGLDAWILVLDTRGVNVWCAAGKKTFSTAEVVRRVDENRLGEVVDHRRLVLPQLSATGVSAREVKKGCGFEVVWGPIRAKDVKPFLEAGMKADETMRRVTFSLAERLVLVPIEFPMMKKPVLWALLIVFVLSGVGPSVFSLQEAWGRGWLAALALFTGTVAGAVLTPLLLPWIPSAAFSVKGAAIGLIGSAPMLALVWDRAGWFEMVSLVLLALTISSYLAMNFTGSTPFTSPSGVEKEMRRAIPFQAGALLLAAVVWVGAAFTA